AVSEDGEHLLAHLILQTGNDQTDEHIVLDGAIVVQENQAAVPAGNGNWDNFDLVAVNDAGNWLLTGDTTAADATDEFVAYNGSAAGREGDTVDDGTLPAASTLRFVGLNDWNQATHAWNLGGGNSAVFFACDAGDLAGTSQLVLANADELDLDGD